MGQVVDRIGHTFRTLNELQRYEGRLLHWYDIASLQPLQPRYGSIVDSGNLLVCLWTLEPGLQELIREPIIGSHALWGMYDTLMILRGSSYRNRAGSSASDSMSTISNSMARITTC